MYTCIRNFRGKHRSPQDTRSNATAKTLTNEKQMRTYMRDYRWRYR